MTFKAVGTATTQLAKPVTLFTHEIKQAINKVHKEMDELDELDHWNGETRRDMIEHTLFRLMKELGL